MTTKSKIEEDVLITHQLFWQSYADRDLDLRFSMCLDDATFIGTGLHERAMNKNEYRLMNQKGVEQYPHKFKIEFLWTHLSFANDVAWVESESIWTQNINDQVTKELLRNTTILRFENGRWWIAHVHGSNPDYRLKDGEYMTNEVTIIKNKELEQEVYQRTLELNQSLDALKTAQVQLENINRELEIETSLERVRSIAMGMKQPADMLDVCKIISDQLHLLRVVDLRNVQTAIIDRGKSYYINYQYFTPYQKGTIESTEYNKHPKVRELVEQMQRSADAFFTASFEGEELDIWRQYRKDDKQFPDPVLDNATSVYFYFYSIGEGGLGVSTYNPLPEEHLTIFKRFRNVFELAYRRYQDVELAISQAKESRIETALERVRAVAMAMRKPDELSVISETLFTELKALGFSDLRNTEIIINHDNKEFITSYYFSDYGVTGIIDVDYTTNEIVKGWITTLKKADDAFAEVIIHPDEMEAWRSYRVALGYKADPKLDQVLDLYYYSYSIGLGALSISSFTPVANDQIKILERFRNVFNLAYQRYADIALAETQTKEAKIELSLERIRARTMAMHHSDELVETSTVLFHELQTLEIESIRTGVGIFNDGDKTVEIWSSQWIEQRENKVLGIVRLNIHPFFEGYYKSWKANEPYFSYSMKDEEIPAYYKALSPIISYPESKAFNATETFYTFFFPEGSLNVITISTLSDEACSILVRFARVFGLIYRRFLDLKQAEAQAREAMIEAALERVRSRTMAMQRSDELPETAQILFQQFKALGESPIQITIGIFNETEGLIDFNVTDWSGGGHQINKNFSASIEEPTLMQKVFKAWKANQKSVVVDLTGQELLDWVAYRNAMSGTTDHQFSVHDRRTVHVGFFSKGLISFSTHIPSPAESVSILERFSNVFDQTYTRFLDLQKAEAQAREAQIEAALERVRSRSMGMQKSAELKNVIQVVYDQFVYLNIHIEHTGFIMDYKAR
ncbi:MAG: nuclear transport factor 2 family protein, partial [Saprospiraceae bacterium]